MTAKYEDSAWGAGFVVEERGAGFVVEELFVDGFRVSYEHCLSRHVFPRHSSLTVKTRERAYWRAALYLVDRPHCIAYQGYNGDRHITRTSQGNVDT